MTAEAGTVQVDVTQQSVGIFTRGAQAIQCEESFFSAFVSNGVEEITTEVPSFSKCTGPGGLPVTVTLNGCKFLFKLTADKVDTFTAFTSLKCPTPSTVMEIHVYGNATNRAAGISVCTYTYKEEGNQNLIGTDMTNEPISGFTPKDWVLAHLKVNGLRSIRHGSALLCGPEVHTTGGLDKTYEFKGTNAAKEFTGITISTQ
jgi:hypothetical protein